MGIVNLSCHARTVSHLTPNAEGALAIRVVAAPIGHPAIPKGHLYVWAIVQGPRVLVGESTETYTEACARAKLMFDTLTAVQNRKRNTPPEKGIIFG